MAFVLLFILIILAIISYIRGGRDLLSPWFLICFATLASYSLVILNYSNWNVVIYPKFVLYLLTALLAFGLGCAVIRYFNPKEFSRKAERLPVPDSVATFRYPARVMLAVSLITTFGYIGKLLLSGGGLRAIYSSGYTPGFFFNQLMEISMAVAYVSVYKLFMRISSHKDKTNILLLLIPILDAFLVCLISTDRNKLLMFAIFAIVIMIMFYRENTKKAHSNRSIAIKVIIVVAIIALIFYLFGKTKQYTSDFSSQVGIYGGSGLYCFNLWLEKFDGPLMYGKSIFNTFLDILQYFLGLTGIKIDFNTFSQIDETIVFRSQNGYLFVSNIYSGMRPYVEDFGYFGVLIIPFLLGLFFQWLYTRVKRNKYGYSWLIYAMLIYMIIYFPIAERVFRRLHLGLLYEIVWPTIIYYLTLGKARKKKRSKANQPIAAEKRGSVKL